MEKKVEALQTRLESQEDQKEAEKEAEKGGQELVCLDWRGQVSGPRSKGLSAGAAGAEAGRGVAGSAAGGHTQVRGSLPICF